MRAKKLAGPRDSPSFESTDIPKNWSSSGNRWILKFWELHVHFSLRCTVPNVSGKMNQNRVLRSKRIWSLGNRASTFNVKISRSHFSYMRSDFWNLLYSERLISHFRLRNTTIAPPFEVARTPWHFFPRISSLSHPSRALRLTQVTVLRSTNTITDIREITSIFLLDFVGISLNIRRCV